LAHKVSQAFSFVMHEKNDFAEVSKNLARYRFKNNFIELSK